MRGLISPEYPDLLFAIWIGISIQQLWGTLGITHAQIELALGNTVLRFLSLENTI